MGQTEERWLIPNRQLAGQTRYNLKLMKKQIAQYPGASEVMDHHIDALLKLLDSFGYQGDFE